MKYTVCTAVQYLFIEMFATCYKSIANRIRCWISNPKVMSSNPGHGKLSLKPY
jgi:hypothetical protein